MRDRADQAAQAARLHLRIQIQGQDIPNTAQLFFIHCAQQALKFPPVAIPAQFGNGAALSLPRRIFLFFFLVHSAPVQINKGLRAVFAVQLFRLRAQKTAYGAFFLRDLVLGGRKIG